MGKISYQDFEKVEIHVGRIIEVKEGIPGAKKKYYALKIDFGSQIGIKQSAAQITDLYKPKDLLNRLVLAVTNFEPKQIADFKSEVLTLGVPDEKGRVILLNVDKEAQLGTRIF